MLYVMTGLIGAYIGWYLSKREYKAKQKQHKKETVPCEPSTRETKDYMYVENWSDKEYGMKLKELKENA